MKIRFVSISLPFKEGLENLMQTNALFAFGTFIFLKYDITEYLTLTYVNFLSVNNNEHH